MLPDFRFLFGAIVLSFSVLVFGVGAAALLRAAHEEFASNPTWRAPAEPIFAQREAGRPALAVLQVNAPPSTSTAAPASSVNASAADLSASTGTDRNTLVGPEQASSPESGQTEAASVETAKPVDAAPAPPGMAVPAPDTNNRTQADATASSASAQPPEQGPAVASAPIAESAPSTAGAETASSSLAALGDEPAAQTSTPVAHAPIPPPTANAEAEAKKRARAEREKERRRAAKRARVLTQATVQEPGAAEQALPPQLFGSFPPLVQPSVPAGQPAAGTTARKR